MVERSRLLTSYSKSVFAVPLVTFSSNPWRYIVIYIIILQFSLILTRLFVHAYKQILSTSYLQAFHAYIIMPRWDLDHFRALAISFVQGAPGTTWPIDILNRLIVVTSLSTVVQLIIALGVCIVTICVCFLIINSFPPLGPRGLKPEGPMCHGTRVGAQ